MVKPPWTEGFIVSNLVVTITINVSCEKKTVFAVFYA